VKSEQHQTDAAPAEPESIDKQLTQLRSQISDLGFELDSHKKSIAVSMGVGAFLLLLAVIAGYVLYNGKDSIWLPLGVSRNLLLFIAWGLGGAGVILLIQGLIQQLRRDHEPEARLAELEGEYSRLLDDKEARSQEQS